MGIAQDVRVLAAMPRFTAIDNVYTAMRVALTLGLNEPKFFVGVFWGENLENLLDDAIADGVKYAVAIDCDTVFSADDFVSLYESMEGMPGVSVLSAMMVKRGDSHPFYEKSLPRDFDGSAVTQVHTGNFGLTFFRVADLLRVAKPWFDAVADESGGWRGDGYRPQDIAFWDNLYKAGLVVMQANDVPIGHMQWVVSWPGSDLAPVHQHVEEWRLEGKPEYAWKRPVNDPNEDT